MSKMLLWEKIDLPFMLTMDRKSWQLCAIPPLACSAVLVFLPSLLVCATTLVIPMLLYKSYPSLLVRMHKPCFGGHLLLTTRAQATGRLAERIEVGTMEWGIGALLLLRRAGLVA